MWDQSDFESLREEYQDHARDFTESGSNSLTGRTLFVTTHTPRQFHDDLETGKGEHVNKETACNFSLSREVLIVIASRDAPPLAGETE